MPPQSPEELSPAWISPEDTVRWPHRGRQPVVRSRANITSACLICKKRKRKCLGGVPCPHCQALGIQCLYDERHDKRRKAFGERARAEMNFQGKLLGGLLRVIKSEHAPVILNLIRADAPIREIADKLEQMDMIQDFALDYPPDDPMSPELLRSFPAFLEPAPSLTSEPRSASSSSDSYISHMPDFGRLFVPRHQPQPGPARQVPLVPSLPELLLKAQQRNEILPLPIAPPSYMVQPAFGHTSTRNDAGHRAGGYVSQIHFDNRALARPLLPRYI